MPQDSSQDHQDSFNRIALDRKSNSQGQLSGPLFGLGSVTRKNAGAQLRILSLWQPFPPDHVVEARIGAETGKTRIYVQEKKPVVMPIEAFVQPLKCLVTVANRGVEKGRVVGPRRSH